jgi:hypothetical protein
VFSQVNAVEARSFPPAIFPAESVAWNCTFERHLSVKSSKLLIPVRRTTRKIGFAAHS